MDKNRREELEKIWIEYVKGSNGGWKKYHSRFINAYIGMYSAALKWTANQPGGKERIAEFRRMDSALTLH